MLFLIRYIINSITLLSDLVLFFPTVSNDICLIIKSQEGDTSH